MVTTLVVVWIEIVIFINLTPCSFVTTLVVVWIEITLLVSVPNRVVVTTLVVVWIEIAITVDGLLIPKSHHSRSGVD